VAASRSVGVRIAARDPTTDIDRSVRSGYSFAMALLRGLFWFALFIVFTFCFVVLFEYGPRNFANGVQKEYTRVKSFVVKQAEGIGKRKKS
jgi:hypothetical protein